MIRIYLFLTALLLSFTTSLAQNPEKKASLNSGTINDKFNYVINESNNYQNYKVIKKDWLHSLKRQVLDSVNKQKETNTNLVSKIETQQQQIESLTNQVATLNDTITQINTDKEHIAFLGIDFKKGDFKNIFWAIVGILAVLLAFFIFKFKNSHVITKETKAQLLDIEKEFEEHRKVALEREQKVMRKLQDELNKNKSN